jgi:ribosome recycling factor
MESAEEVLLDTEEKMVKSVGFLQEQFDGIRTGKASPALVENVQVPYYGTPTRLRELSNISTPEPRLIVIQPYDPTALGDIEKAIIGANLGVTPMNDGRLVRVPIPELSEERRVEMTKLAKRTAEEGRIAVRNVRRDANEQVKGLQKDGKITEDDRDESLKTIQTLTDKYVKEIDDMVKAKETEIMEV